MQNIRQSIRHFNLGRIVAEIDQELDEAIGSGLNAKRLRTRRNIGLTRLPSQLELAAQLRLKRLADSNFRAEAKRLFGIIYHSKLPDNPSTVQVKKADLQTQLEIRGKLGPNAFYDPSAPSFQEEIDKGTSELRNLIEGKLEDKKRDWHYYDYDDYASNLYMAVRLSPNFSVIRTVMDEIRNSYPNYEPNSVMDFGSGMGTSIWAVRDVWPKAQIDFTNIELSKSQQDLCTYLLRGEEYGDQIPNVYHKQYLPVSTKVQYDMVISAFSMLDLPTEELRTSTIENLWHKTNDLLVLIERGNEGGFKIIEEARNLLLDLSGYDITRKWSIVDESRLRNKIVRPSATIVAPCSNHYTCPRAMMPSKKRMNVCRFQVVFEPLEFGEKLKSPHIKEEFSYVVFSKKCESLFEATRKGTRWPRIVEPRHRSGGLVSHRLCTPDGNLAEVSVTKKHGKSLFQLAKSCNWGDILPVSVKDTYEKRSSGTTALSPLNKDKDT